MFHVSCFIQVKCALGQVISKELYSYVLRPSPTANVLWASHEYPFRIKKKNCKLDWPTLKHDRLSASEKIKKNRPTSCRHYQVGPGRAESCSPQVGRNRKTRVEAGASRKMVATVALDARTHPPRGRCSPASLRRPEQLPGDPLPRDHCPHFSSHPRPRSGCPHLSHRCARAGARGCCGLAGQRSRSIRRPR